MYQHEKKKAENVCIFFTFFSLKLNYFASKILFDKLFNNEAFNQEAFDEVRQIIKEEAGYKTDFDVTNCIIRIAKAAHKHQFTLKEEFVNSWIFLMNFQLAIKEIDPEMLFCPGVFTLMLALKLLPNHFIMLLQAGLKQCIYNLCFHSLFLNNLYQLKILYDVLLMIFLV